MVQDELRILDATRARLKRDHEGLDIKSAKYDLEVVEEARKIITKLPARVSRPKLRTAASAVRNVAGNAADPEVKADLIDAAYGLAYEASSIEGEF